MKQILVAGHVSPIHGPVQALEKYLNSSKDYQVTFLKHELFSNSPLAYFADFAKNIIAAYKHKGKFDLFIGIDNLNALSGVVLKALGKVDTLIYYVIDYTPRRFANPALNFIYHAIEKTAAKKADYIWNISERIKEVHAKQGIPESKNLVVPVGVFPERFSKVPESEISKNKIVILSQLDINKGIQLAIEAMAELSERHPELELNIIGSGPYEQELKSKAKSLEPKANIKFRGYMNPSEFIPFMQKCGIALAPYLDNPNSITYYCDPTKVKEYLAAGLPVITTNVPWIATDIEKVPMGIVVNYNKEELISAIEKLVSNSEFWKTCRNNALGYMEKMDWESIYKEALNQAGVLDSSLP